jgi:hypothetical protein
MMLALCAVALPMAAVIAGGSTSSPLSGKTTVGDYPGTKVIYGVDDRLDIFEVTDPTQLDLASSVCGVVFASSLTPRFGRFELSTSPYEVGGLPGCLDEPFRDQRTAAFCTAFLVADDLVVTAGHCYNEFSLAQVRFVFGFTMADADTPVTTFSEDQVYQGVEVVSQAFQGGSVEVPDYAVVRLDRPVTAPGAQPLEIRRRGSVAVGTQVGAIGHPMGLPLKVAVGSDTTVQLNTEADTFFNANLDVYSGNSGSPIFNASTGVVEGILKAGNPDFVNDPDAECFESSRLGNDLGGEGDGFGLEISTKASFLKLFVPVDFCSGFDEIENEFQDFLADFGLTSDDLDSDGIPEEFLLGLLKLSACSAESDGLAAATSSAIRINHTIIKDELQAADLTDYANILATLLLVSQDMQAAITTILADAGITLTQSYEVVSCDGAGLCLPAKIGGYSLSEAYDAFAPGSKSITEPYSGTGDYDGDGIDNITELDTVLARNGNAYDFVNAAGDPSSDGTFCSDVAAVNTQFQDFLTDFAITSDDFDGDGVREALALALVNASACLSEPDALSAATSAAFSANRAALRDEANASELADYVNALAALLLVSENTQASVVAILEDAGFTLTQAYQAVTCDSMGLCLPAKDAGAAAKTTDEPYSGTGDYDLDGVDNATEVANVRTRNGSADEELTAVEDPTLDGSEQPVGCAAGSGQRPGQAFGDLLLIAMAMLSLLASTRFRKI